MSTIANWKLSRRTFLKATGALGAAAAVGLGGPALLEKSNGPVKAQSVESEETIYHTFCPGCGFAGGCPQLVHVKDGRITEIEPKEVNFPLNFGKACAKGMAMKQWVYSPQRLRYPLKRVGERGEARFKRITWDEALDEISSRLLDIRQKYGAEAFASMKGQTSGWFGPQHTWSKRFMYAYGSPNAVSGGAEVCFVPRINAFLMTIGYAPGMGTGFPVGEPMNSKLMICWGNNPGVSYAARSGVMGVLDAQERGAKIVVINPDMTPLASHADIWVPIRPGTDAALALAMIHVSINENLYDADFVEKWCFGFDELKHHVQQYTPEWAEPITGISAERIREVTRLYMTTKPAAILTGNGLDHLGADTTNAVRAVAILMALSGNLDKKGGDVCRMSAPMTFNYDDGRSLLSDEQKAKAIGYEEFPLWIKTNMGYGNAPMHNHYLLREAIITGKPYPVKAVMVQPHNPITNQHNPERVVEALKSLDFLLVVDVVMTPSARYADIVLPAATSYEYDGKYETFTWSPSIYPRNKVIEPVGESRSDWRILFDLAVKMGFGEAFSNGDIEADLDKMLKPMNLTMQEIRKHPEDGLFVGEWPPQTYEKYEQIFSKLPNGKVQLYCEILAKNGYNPLPIYVGPPESKDKTPDLVNDYPLIMYDPHGDELSHHSYLRGLPWLRELRKYPYIKINPETAAKHGIREGDWVKVESPHGWMKAMAWLFPGIPADTLQGKHGWWQGCEELGIPEYEALQGGVNVSVLYEDPLVAHDPVSATWWKTTLVRISKTTPPPQVSREQVES